LICGGIGWAIAQEPAPGPAKGAAGKPAPPPNVVGKTGTNTGYRPLAPGVIITIPPENEKAEERSRHDLIRLLDKSPDFGERRDPKNPDRVVQDNLAKQVRLSHDIWCLEFNFKCMRMIEVDVPRAGEKFDRKVIWYLPYYVRWLGDEPTKEKAKAGEAEAPQEEAAKADDAAKANEGDGKDGDGKEPKSKAVRFLPRFVLVSDQKVKLADGREIPKIYTDRLIPVAMDPIRLKEDPRRTLLNSIEITEKPIPLSTEGDDRGVWGVATWEDIDPKTVYFSVYVQGLTNAYKIETVTEKDEAGQETRRWQYLRKTLVLNFWRPGDDQFPLDREFRFGQPNNVEYRWEFK